VNLWLSSIGIIIGLVVVSETSLWKATT